MELSEIKGLKIGASRHVDLVEVLFRYNRLLLTRPSYATGVNDWERREETDDERQMREDDEEFQRSIPKEYRDEPQVNPPYLDCAKYLEGHNQTPRASFPIRVDDIIGIRRLGIVTPSEQSKYTPSGLVEVRWENPIADMGSEIRAGYVKYINEIVSAWEQPTPANIVGTRKQLTLEDIDKIYQARKQHEKAHKNPHHIDLYTHLKNGVMQSPIRMKSMKITRLNRLYIAESVGFG